MMNLLQGTSDDQMALMGCFVALVGSVLLMYVSFFVGPAARKKSDGTHSTDSRPISSRSVIEIPSESKHGRAA